MIWLRVKSWIVEQPAYALTLLAQGANKLHLYRLSELLAKIANVLVCKVIEWWNEKRQL